MFSASWLQSLLHADLRISRAGAANEALHTHSTQLGKRLAAADSEICTLRSECARLRLAVAGNDVTQGQVRPRFSPAAPTLT